MGRGLAPWPRGARTLAQADYPGAADGFPAAAIVHFSAANGIELLDGDGSGGGTPVRTGRPAGRSGQSQWTRVTLRLDYDTRTWECYLDGEKAHPGSLGFRDNGATLQALRLQAGATGEADAFRVLAPLRGDANVDGVVDAADLVRARQYLSFDPSTYDIIGVLNVSESNATDGEGRPVVTESDLAALRQRILAGP